MTLNIQEGLETVVGNFSSLSNLKGECVGRTCSFFFPFCIDLHSPSKYIKRVKSIDKGVWMLYFCGILQWCAPFCA